MLWKNLYACSSPKITLQNKAVIWERRPTVAPNSTSAMQKGKISSEAAKDLNSRETFIPGKQFPLSSIVNVHADQPAKGVMLKITVDMHYFIKFQPVQSASICV